MERLNAMKRQIESKYHSVTPNRNQVLQKEESANFQNYNIKSAFKPYKCNLLIQEAFQAHSKSACKQFSTTTGPRGKGFASNLRIRGNRKHFPTHTAYEMKQWVSNMTSNRATPILGQTVADFESNLPVENTPEKAITKHLLVENSELKKENQDNRKVINSLKRKYSRLNKDCQKPDTLSHSISSYPHSCRIPPQNHTPINKKHLSDLNSILSMLSNSVKKLKEIHQVRMLLTNVLQ